MKPLKGPGDRPFAVMAECKGEPRGAADRSGEKTEASARGGWRGASYAQVQTTLSVFALVESNQEG
jgi:hypothetical protein